LEAPAGIGIITDESQILGQHSESDLEDTTVFEHQGKAVEFELLKVDVAVDASISSATKLNYALPDNIPLSRATLWYGSDQLGWTKWDEQTDLTGSGFLSFDQNFIDPIGFGDPNPIDRDLKLELEISGQSLEFMINADRIERMETASELITSFWLDVGTRIFNHTIVERYYDMVYSVPATGKLRQLARSFASVDLGSSDFTAGTETHKYNPEGDPAQGMNFNSAPPLGGSPDLVSWTLSTQLWIDTTATLIDEGVCTNSGISVLTGTGPAFGGSTNTSVDVSIY
jgi:hypothetical protein